MCVYTREWGTSRNQQSYFSIPIWFPSLSLYYFCNFLLYSHYLFLLESYSSVCGAFLDLRNAFDSVPHQPLLDLLTSSNLPLPFTQLASLIPYQPHPICSCKWLLFLISVSFFWCPTRLHSRSPLLSYNYFCQQSN